MARLKDLKVVMLKGDKGDVGFPSDEQVKGQIAEYINENPEVTINKEVIENTTTEWLNNNPTLGTQLNEKIDSDIEIVVEKIDTEIGVINDKLELYVPIDTYNLDKKKAFSTPTPISTRGTLVEKYANGIFGVMAYPNLAINKSNPSEYIPIAITSITPDAGDTDLFTLSAFSYDKETGDATVAMILHTPDGEAYVGAGVAVSLGILYKYNEFQ